MKQTGFAWIELIPYLVAGAAIVGAITYVYQLVDNNWATDAGIAKGIAKGKSQTEAKLKPKLEKCLGDIAETKRLGLLAEEKARRDAEVNAKAKENADAERDKAKRDLAGVYDAYTKLRDARIRASVLPASPAGATGAAGITFDRAALDRGLAEADGVLQRGVEKILRRGDQAVEDLNNAKRWAQRAKPAVTSP